MIHLAIILSYVSIGVINGVVLFTRANITIDMSNIMALLTLAMAKITFSHVEGMFMVKISINAIILPWTKFWKRPTHSNVDLILKYIFLSHNYNNISYRY